MAEFSELAAFIAVSRHKSFTRAARERSVTSSALSHTIKVLEDRLGVRLFNRTTRAVVLTEAGVALLAALEPALSSVSRALDTVNAYRSSTMGTIRLNVPRPAGRLVMGLVIADFLAENPDINIEVETSDGFIDIVDGGFDAGVRYADAVPLDMVTVPIQPIQRFAVVGSKEFVDRFGIITHPGDIARVPCIQRRFPSGRLYDWEFSNGQEELIIKTDGRLIVDDDEIMLHGALKGLGLSFTYEEFVGDYIRSGQLIRMLDDWCQPFPGFVLYYPSARHASAAFRRFIDWIYIKRRSDNGSVVRD
ncbi:LysR family transcriptional regulator [Methylobacterium radiotolerans]|uniref:LysR family transcriptional regulator n=1 Tax=Methylobacterium radiotolerans TaxID=31998 RepID=UPI001AED0E1E|nr:LysR family transcriptional regulator [Methylobacterium radiotolerans]